MRTVKIHEAKTHFSALIHDVRTGEQIIISRGDEPVAKLIKGEIGKLELPVDLQLFVATMLEPGKISLLQLTSDHAFEL